MAVRSDITTGEQAVAATGAITGSLDTSALTGAFTIKLRVSGLSAAKVALIAIEDTANVTPFSDAIQVAVAHFTGGMTSDGSAREWAQFEIPATRFGVANSKLRANCLSLSATPGSVKAYCWIEQ